MVLYHRASRAAVRVTPTGGALGIPGQLLAQTVNAPQRGVPV
jgi:hypothetical protein